MKSATVPAGHSIEVRRNGAASFCASVASLAAVLLWCPTLANAQTCAVVTGTGTNTVGSCRGLGTPSVSFASDGTLETTGSSAVVVDAGTAPLNVSVDTSAGDVVARGPAISVRTRGNGDVVVRSGASITATGTGGTVISTRKDGTGTSGAIRVDVGRIAGAGAGITIRQSGTGDVAVAADEIVTGGGNAVDLAVGTASAGALSIDVDRARSGSASLRVDSQGSGAVSITSSGSVVSTGGPAIEVNARNNPARLASTTIRANDARGARGIAVFDRNTVGGRVEIAVTGDVIGTTGQGILAQTGRWIDIEVLGSVGGSAEGIRMDTDGVVPRATGGMIRVRDGASVTGGSAAAIRDTDGGGPGRNTVLDIAGTLSGGAAGAASFGGGDDVVVLRETARVTGDVDGGSGNDLLRLDFASAAAFDAGGIGTQYRSFERFETAGAATFTGAGTAAAGWRVTSGRLVQSSASPGFSFDVAPGARLVASARSGAVSVDGTLEASAPVALDGPLTVRSGGRLVSQFATDGTAGRIDAAGAATIEPGARLTFEGVDAGAVALIGTPYRLLTAPSLAGRFDAVDAPANPDLLLELSYGANALDATFVANPNGTPKEAAPVAAMTTLVVADAFLAQITIGAALRPVRDTLSFLPRPALRGRALSVNAYGFDARVDGAGGYDTAGTGQIVALPATVELGGLLVDVGAAIGRARSDTASRAAGSGSGSVRTSDLQAGLWARATSGPVGIDAALAVSSSDVDVARSFAIGAAGVTARGRTEARSASADFRLSYALNADRFGTSVGLAELEVRPYVGLGWRDATLDGYVETGAGSSNLVVDETRATTRSVRLGVDLAGRVATPVGPVMPWLSIGVERRSGDLAVRTTSSLVGLGGTFASTAPATPAGTAHLVLGADMDIGPARLSIAYDLTGGGGTRSQNLGAAVRWRF